MKYQNYISHCNNKGIKPSLEDAFKLGKTLFATDSRDGDKGELLYGVAEVIADAILSQYATRWDDLGDTNSLWDAVEGGHTTIDDFRDEVRELVKERLADNGYVTETIDPVYVNQEEFESILSGEQRFVTTLNDADFIAPCTVAITEVVPDAYGDPKETGRKVEMNVSYICYGGSVLGGNAGYCTMDLKPIDTVLYCPFDGNPLHENGLGTYSCSSCGAEVLPFLDEANNQAFTTIKP